MIDMNVGNVQISNAYDCKDYEILRYLIKYAMSEAKIELLEKKNEKIWELIDENEELMILKPILEI